MQDSPLVQTFGTLSKPERRAFGKWLGSPFFNSRSDVLRLFEYLCAHVPAGEKAMQQPVDKLSAYSQVFPPGERRSARAYSDADMRHAMSFLFQALKQFLAYQHWAQDEVDTGRHLCKSLRERGLDQVFEKEFAALNERLSASPHRSAEYFFQQYHLHVERWEVFRRSNRGASDALRLAGAARDAHIASETLRQACALLARPGEQAPDATSVFLEATLGAVAAGAFNTVPAVMAYYHCYLLLSEEDAVAEPHFRSLRSLLDAHWDLFPNNEVRDLYVGAINYCIRRLNGGARTYIGEALDLYRSGLQHRVLLEDGYLNRYAYNNILLLALAQEDWDWALQFLEQYKSVLPPRDRDSAWRYNLATYYFRKKDYRQAQEILSRVEFRDVFYHLDARRMLVRIYFDTDATSALESLLDSFTIYLQRKRSALGYHRELNLNFVRFVKRLLQLEPGNTAARRRLAEKIGETRMVAEREWLLAVCG